MIKTRPPLNDTNKTIHHPLPAIKRKSESDDSSDCRSSLESPTTHSYAVGTRPRRTLPRRALSTGGVEFKTTVLGMDVQSARRFQSGLCKPTITPPRSKSATSFRAFDRKDPILPIPKIGSRRVYTPNPPSLSRFYDASRRSSDEIVSIQRSSSSSSIARKLNGMKIHFTGALRPRKSAILRKTLDGPPGTRRQVSPNPTPASRRTLMYISDEDMHISTTTEEDDSDTEDPAARSVPSSAIFFRTIRLQHVLKPSDTPSPSAARLPPQSVPPAPQRRPLNLLQPSNCCAAPPLVIIDKCKSFDSSEYYPATKRVKRSRDGLAPPSHHQSGRRSFNAVL